MKSLHKFYLIPAAAALVFSSSLTADDHNTLSGSEKKEGWRLLFNGKDTSGWRGFQKDSFPAQGWVVEDGTLKCETAPAGPDGKHKSTYGGDIITVDKFTDFEVTWQWKMLAGSNSGLKYFIDEKRVDAKGKLQKSAVGHEFQLLDDLGHPDAKRGETHRTGALYDLLPPKDAKVKPLGEWNESRLVIKGKHVEHWVNGRKTVEYEIGSPEVNEAFAKSKFTNIPTWGDKIATPLLLQDHGGGVWFRDIKIRELK